MRATHLLLLSLIVKASGLSYSGLFFRVASHYINEALNEVGNDTECTKQLQILLNDLKNTKIWAIRMFDASAKTPPGILTGNLVLHGNYDECLDIDLLNNGSRIKGQYCRTMLSPSSATNECAIKKLTDKQIFGLGKIPWSELIPLFIMVWHVCVPAACSATQLQVLWDFLEEKYQLMFKVAFDDVNCDSIEKRSVFAPIDIAAFAIFGVLGMVVLMSTLYDVFIFQHRKDKRKEFDIFMAFSFYTNGKRLFTVSSATEEAKITCLSGIRVISIVWIILGHRAMFNYMGTSINSSYAIEWFKHEENMFIIGAFACVDSFFFVSGFLVIYIILLAKENGIRINVVVFYIHRLLRIFPSLAAMILIYVGIMQHLGHGPYWNYVLDLLRRPCLNNWWSTLTFTTNYLHPNPFDMCLIHSWYLAVDTQLYVLSPLIFLPLQRWPKVTISGVVVLIIASAATAVYATFHYEIETRSLRVAFDYVKHIYNPTHIRMGPWLIGTLFGYFMYSCRGRKIHIKKHYNLLIWIVCVGLLLLNIYSHIVFLKYRIPISTIAIFVALSRLMWAACVSWVIFACVHGYGGLINTFLSHQIFQLLARLTFSMYITHILILGVVEGQRKTTAYIDNLNHFHAFWGDFAFTVGLSIIWTLAFESPVNILEKVLLKRALKDQHQREEKYDSKTL